MALRNIGADFEHHKVVEFDRFAIASYNAIHETDFKVTDITEIKGEDLEIADTDKYEYIMTYSFPCQDLSVAGKGQGMAKGSGTRSGLLWEVERLLNEVEELPQVLLMENVPQVIGKKNIEHFKEWREFLESKGYANFVDTLNAKNYGVAQNRNRTFMVSILGEYSYEFPRPIELTKVIADYLEPEVDEKFYINNEKTDKLIEQLKGQLRNKQEGILLSEQATKVDKKTDVANTLLARDYKGFGNQPMNEVVEPIRLGGLYDTDKAKRQAGAVWDKDCISPTIDSNRQQMIIDFYNNNIKSDSCVGTITTNSNFTGSGVFGVLEPTIVRSVGRNPNNPSDRTTGSPMVQRLELNSEGICNTLTTVQKDNMVLEPSILTPKRTEYGKAIRKDYESGKIQESRHNMTELQPREDRICNTLTTVQKDNYLLEPTNEINMIEIQQTVKIRKYPVDIEKLKNLLKEHKNLSNKEIAIKLNTTITTVEHWFRKDNCFSIPEPNIWFSLKELLNITTNEFDDAITEFVEKEGVYEKANRIYTTNGISPTITSTTANEKILEPQYRIRKLTPKECWRLMGFTDEDFHKAEQVNSNSQLYKQAGNSIALPVLESIFRMMF